MATLAPPEPLLEKYQGRITPQEGLDQPCWIVDRKVLREVCQDLKTNPETRFDLLLESFGMDFPESEERFEGVYHLYSIQSGKRLRLKVPLPESDPTLPSLWPVWKASNWFERETFDHFGFRFEGHPDLRRILCHEAFQGHALRKDYDPARRWICTEKDIAKTKLNPPPPRGDDMFERMTINIGPSHPAMHGTFRLSAVLDGEVIVDSDMEIGYLHRCFDKMSETHTWNQVIPYTDRLNYCSAIINNVGYCKTVERMLGIEAPPRAVWARTILSEFS